MNRVLLKAQLLERQALRYTPAGLPALDLVVKHESQVMEADLPRKVQLELRAVAIGNIAQALNRQPIGSDLNVVGFLGATRSGRGVLLHITELNESF
ncbi:MAG: primosomal replication protein N [Aquabacterium sp.]